MTSPKSTAPQKETITGAERDEAEHKTRLKSRVVFEIIRREGEAELARPANSLWWSGVAAGACISMSLIFEALLRIRLPDAEWRPAIENIGYTAGFLLVVLGRLQLFTENTVTAVLPTIAAPTWARFRYTARLWAIVLLANFVGAFFAALLIAKGGIISEDAFAASVDIAKHFADRPAGELFTRALPAGFLIASIVWMIPNSEGNEFWVVFLFTYIIALGDFAHIIAGSVETFLLLIEQQLSLFESFGLVLAPVLLGNAIGGTGLFALLAWGQVKEEI